MAIRDNLNNGTNKISKSDIVDNLMSDRSDLPLSARQGKELAARLNGCSITSKTITEYDSMGSGRPSDTLYILYEEE